jgi:Protein of unknown function (DUF3631)
VAAVTLVGVQRDAQPSLGIRLLSDIKMVFDESGRPHLPTKVLIASLIALEESPWGDLKGRQLDERALASRLRKYEVKPKTLRLDAVTTIKGYERTDFYDAWARYLAPLPKDDSSVTSVTSVTDEPRRPPPVSAVTDVTPKRSMGGDGESSAFVPRRARSRAAFGARLRLLQAVGRDRAAGCLWRDDDVVASRVPVAADEGTDMTERDTGAAA